MTNYTPTFTSAKFIMKDRNDRLKGATSIVAVDKEK
jgi:hypothetical protein